MMQKLALFGIAFLLMGSMGISGGLAVIAGAFEHESQTAIQMLVSLPSVMMIPCTLLMGKLLTVVPKKRLAALGLSLYLIGGLLPVFGGTLAWILVCRALFGVGIGILAPLLTLLVTECFEEPERSKVMGQQISVQMIGCAVMVLSGGYLADAGWNKSFLIYGVSAVSLVLALLFLPLGHVPKEASASVKQRLNSRLLGWAALMFVFFVAGQVFATFVPFLIEARSFGAGAESGRSAMLFTLGGFAMGLFYGKLRNRLRAFAVPLALVIIVFSFLLIALSTTLAVVYAGSFAAGLAYAIVTPEVLLQASAAAPTGSIPLALSVVICGQNVAQFISPAIISPAAALLGGDPNRNAFLLGAGIFAALTVVFLARLALCLKKQPLQ